MKRFDYKTIIGHELVCEKLQQAVKSGRTVSAYVLSGAAGIGKKTVCRAFTAALLCETPVNGNACGVCESCRLLAADSHPDCIHLLLPEDKKTIGVDLVRDVLIKEASIKPFTSGRKVFIVNDADTMTVQAQNALLKVLEEPPQYAVFILLSQNKEALLDTVLSRALKLQLLPLPLRLCEGYFKTEQDVDATRLAFVSRFCQGVLGRGKRMLGDDAYYDLYQSTVQQLASFHKSDAAFTDMQRFLTDQKEQVNDITDFMLLFLRDCLRMHTSGIEKMICIDHKTAVQQLSRALEPASFVRMMEAVIKYRERLQKNANFTAASLELMCVIQEEIHDKSSRNPL